MSGVVFREPSPSLRQLSIRTPEPPPIEHQSAAFAEALTWFDPIQKLIPKRLQLPVQAVFPGLRIDLVSTGACLTKVYHHPQGETLLSDAISPHRPALYVPDEACLLVKVVDHHLPLSTTTLPYYFIAVIGTALAAQYAARWKKHPQGFPIGWQGLYGPYLSFVAHCTKAGLYYPAVAHLGKNPRGVHTHHYQQLLFTWRREHLIEPDINQGETFEKRLAGVNLRLRKLY